MEYYIFIRSPNYFLTAYYVLGNLLGGFGIQQWKEKLLFLREIKKW